MTDNDIESASTGEKSPLSTCVKSEEDGEDEIIKECIKQEEGDSGGNDDGFLPSRQDITNSYTWKVFLSDSTFKSSPVDSFKHVGLLILV